MSSARSQRKAIYTYPFVLDTLDVSIFGSIYFIVLFVAILYQATSYTIPVPGKAEKTLPPLPFSIYLSLYIYIIAHSTFLVAIAFYDDSFLLYFLTESRKRKAMQTTPSPIVPPSSTHFSSFSSPNQQNQSSPSSFSSSSSSSTPAGAIHVDTSQSLQFDDLDQFYDLECMEGQPSKSDYSAILHSLLKLGYQLIQQNPNESNKKEIYEKIKSHNPRNDSSSLFIIGHQLEWLLCNTNKKSYSELELNNKINNTKLFYEQKIMKFEKEKNERVIEYSNEIRKLNAKNNELNDRVMNLTTEISVQNTGMQSLVDMKFRNHLQMIELSLANLKFSQVNRIQPTRTHICIVSFIVCISFCVSLSLFIYCLCFLRK